MRVLLFAVVLAACASQPPAQAPTAAPVIAAERAFAADGATRGWGAAFRRAAAPEALTLSPGPVNAQANLAEIDGDGDTSLAWAPAFAGISIGGDFGFTTGPFWVRGRDGILGHYFTVWRRQPDGGWKWIFDAGTNVRDAGPPVADNADIPTLPVALEHAASGEVAIAEVTALEAGRPSPAALAELLAHNGRVNRPDQAPAVGRAVGLALFAADGALTYAPYQREAAASGDMVFSLGEVRGGETPGYYARIWQRRPEGWRIVFDEIVLNRG